MNTERPENDDAAREPGKGPGPAEAGTGTPRAGSEAVTAGTGETERADGSPEGDSVEGRAARSAEGDSTESRAARSGGAGPEGTKAGAESREAGADHTPADHAGAPGATETPEARETKAARAEAAETPEAGARGAEPADAREAEALGAGPAETPGAEIRSAEPGDAREAEPAGASGAEARSAEPGDAREARTRGAEPGGAREVAAFGVGADSAPGAAAAEAFPARDRAAAPGSEAGVAGPAAEDPPTGRSEEAVAADEHVVGAVAGGQRPPGRRPRRSPALVASVAAAVLLVGGGAAWLTSNAAGGSGGGAGAGSPSGDDPAAALLLDDYSAAPSGTAGTSQSGTNGIAPGEPNPYGVTYTVAGTLPDGPASAPVYWAKGEVTKDEVARLAEALQVEGTPVADGDAWKVGAGNDGSGPVLRVNRQAPGMWTFTRFAPGTDNCTSGTDKCSGTSVPSAGAPVSEAVAKKAAAPVLKATGQDGAEVDASQVMGTQRVVNADPVIGALPTYGWTTGVSVGAQGQVVGGNGQLEAPVKGDTYPLLSAREALDALNAAPGTDHRMGIGGCASPVPLKDRLESPCGSSTDAPEGRTATVEDAVLGLAPHTSDGRQVLVPSWLFEVKAPGTADSYTVTQPAVEPAYLKSAATPTPAPSASGGRKNVQVDGYTAEGDELTVSFTGGVCADYKATATASGDEVKVTVTETPWPDKVCILIAKEYRRTVTLDKPLGGREVVGADGGTIPLEKAGARLPQR
ncbi:hypothetical protein AB0G51_11515 [Streptomyces asoensis]|uniref:hypothetical protein n=1 Tax=Streptomyces asoensis TaxID=249586 RepID=UPI0033C77394